MGSELSIVIIGRNEELGLAKCISAAQNAAAQIGGCELIYVDSASTDASVEIATSMGARVLSMRPEWKLCPSAGRYIGSQYAQGEFILFLDADTLLYKDFIAEAIRAFKADPKVAGVNGRIDDLDEGGDLLSDIEDRYDETVRVKWLRGPACFYRKRALLDVGSFDPHLAVEEEAELGLRLVSTGWQMLQIPVPMACHTRCFHLRTIGSIVDAARRDIRVGRVGEIVNTITVAGRNGNALAFCWLRLKTVIIFAAWVLASLLSVFLPFGNGSYVVAAALLFGGFLFLAARKRSFQQAAVFIANKISYIFDLIVGVSKIRITNQNRYPVDVIEQEAR